MKADCMSGAVGLTRKKGFDQNSLANLLATLSHQRAAKNAAH